MRKLLGILTAIAVLFGVGRAEAKNQLEDNEIQVVKPKEGVETIAPMKPDWCAAFKKRGRQSSLDRAKDTMNDPIMRDRWPDRTGYDDLVQIIADAGCEWPDDPSVQKQVAYWRQFYLNVSGVPEKEDRAALKFLVDWDRFLQQVKENQTKYKGWPDEATDEPTRALRRVIRPLLFENYVLGQPDSAKSTMMEFFLDTPGRPVSAIERAAYVWTCMGSYGGEYFDVSAAVMSCGPDAALVDVKAADEEAEAMGLNELGRLRVHTLALSAKSKGERAEADEARQAKKAAARFKSQETIIDHPKQAFAAWDKDVYAPHKELFDAGSKAEAIYWHEADKSERAYALTKNSPIKCAAAFMDEYKKIGAAAEAKSVDDARATIGAPWTQYVLEHLALCDVAEGRALDAWSALNLMSENGKLPARGSRYAIHAINVRDSMELAKDNIGVRSGKGMSDALYEELHDVVKDLVDYPRAWKGDPNANDRDKAEGTIAGMKKNPDGSVTLTFKKETHVWDQEDCVDITSHPLRINSSGKIEYAQKCHAIKPLVVTRLQDPITVSDLAASLVKSGMWVRFVVAEHGGKDKSDKRLWGFPVAAEKPVKGKPGKPIMYAGVLIK